MTEPAFNAVIQILKRLPSSIEMDAQAEALYAKALEGVENQHLKAAMDRVVLECEMRPAPATLLKIIREVSGARPSLPGGVEQERRIVSRAAADQEERKLQQITGISAETAAENRDRARDMIKRLAEKKPIPKAPVWGEIPSHLRGHFDELAEKRQEMDRLFPALASEGK